MLRLRVARPPEAPRSPHDPFCPYRGLDPYTAEFRDYFFGREEDIETIAANVVTAPLTILYGASGVGKTSVLLAGVVPFLSTLPSVTVVVFRTWQDNDVLAALKAEIVRAVTQHTGKDFSVDDVQLDEFLARAARVSQSTLAIIFDQFEEYFLYHGRGDDARSFAFEFARAVTRQDLEVNFLLSLREDALAKLDHFKGRIPNLFDNCLRIDHLDVEAAKRAIEKPLDRYNELQAANGQAVQIEPELVEAVLDQVQTGKIVLGEVGRGGIPSDVADGRVETPYLQLVMTRLWAEEMSAKSTTLRLETLTRLKGTQSIVQTHLDNVMERLSSKQRDTSARLFRYLVTPSGSKIAYTANDLAEYSRVPLQDVERVLQTLAGPDLRLLRPVRPLTTRDEQPRYEIFHDVLALSIKDWRERNLQQARRRYLTVVGGIGITTFLVIIAILIISFQSQAAWLQSQAASSQSQLGTQNITAVAQQATAGVQSQAQQATVVRQALIIDGLAQAVLGTQTPDAASPITRLTVEAVGTSAAKTLVVATQTAEQTAQRAQVDAAAGQAAFGRSNWDLAIRNFESALQLDPGLASQIKPTLARAYYYQGEVFNNQNTDQGNLLAITYFTKAIASDPTFDLPYLERGLLYANVLSNACDKARPDLQHYVDSTTSQNSDSSLLADARIALQKCGVSAPALVLSPTNAATGTPGAQAIAPSVTPTLMPVSPTSPPVTPTLMPVSPTSLPVVSPARISIPSPTTMPSVTTLPPPPLGAQIIWVSNRGGGTDHLYVMEWNGRNPRPLTFSGLNSVAEFLPDYSPVQKLIAFTGKSKIPNSNNYEEDIWSARIDGTGSQQLTTQQFDNWNPVWSPDGSRLAFITSRHGNWQIYIGNMSSDGRRMDSQQRIAASSAIDNQPSWSPNGQAIIFTRQEGTAQHLYRVDLQTQDVQALTNGFVQDVHPRWSPDGQSIVFVRKMDKNGNGSLDDDPSNIWLMNADGSKAHNLTNSANDENDPAISPDSHWISFTRFRFNGATRTDIFTMSINGAAVSQLTFDPADDSSSAWIAP